MISDRLRPAGRVIATIAVMAVAGAASAQDLVATGAGLWAGAADCRSCHGWAGDGIGEARLTGFGLSLRQTKLTEDQIRITIMCGRLESPMPQYDRRAYTDERCDGLIFTDLSNLGPPNSAAPLEKGEIDALAAFVARRLKGAGAVTRSECMAFFGPGGSQTCLRYGE
ncbi:MAG: hypothetical protein U1E56_04575 [Bauldia sp.]